MSAKNSVTHNFSKKSGTMQVNHFVCKRCSLTFETGQMLGGHLRWSCNLKRTLDVMQEQDTEEVHVDDGFDNLRNELVDVPIQVNFVCVCTKKCMLTTKIRMSSILYVTLQKMYVKY